MHENDKNNISWGAIIALCIFIWPIGFYLLYKKLSNSRKASITSGKKLLTTGWVLFGLGLFMMIGAVNMDISSVLIVFFFFICSGLMLIWLGMKAKKQADKFKKYIAIIINQGETEIQVISSVFNIPHVIVEKDLEKMIKNGFFNGSYIDQRTDTIVLPVIGDRNKQKKELKVVKCTSCNASNTFAVGDLAKCEYCGAPLKS